MNDDEIDALVELSIEFPRTAIIVAIGETRIRNIKDRKLIAERCAKIYMDNTSSLDEDVYKAILNVNINIEKE